MTINCDNWWTMWRTPRSNELNEKPSLHKSSCHLECIFWSLRSAVFLHFGEVMVCENETGLEAVQAGGSEVGHVARVGNLRLHRAYNSNMTSVLPSS